jgi:hypothetical protein
MKYKDSIVLYDTVMKIHTKNLCQQITGKVGHMNAIVPHGMENETQKRVLSISYWLDEVYKRYNSTLEGKKDRKGFIGEVGREWNITHGV